MSGEEKESALDFFEKIFQEKRVSDFEREKTLEEKEVLLGVIEKMPEFIKSLGGYEIPFLNLNIFHFLDESKLTDEQRDEFTRGKGSYRIIDQEIFIVPSKMNGSLLALAQAVAHELIHLYAFNSLNLEKADDLEVLLASIRRYGFAISSREEPGFVFFEDLNEAITVELEKTFDSLYLSKLSILEEEYLNRERNKAEIAKNGSETPADDIAYIYEGEKPQGVDFLEGEIAMYVNYFSDKESRKKLWEIIDKIFEVMQEKFQNKDAVFKMFVRAYLRGELLEVAKVIEKVFGRGSFRDLAQETGKSFKKTD